MRLYYTKMVGKDSVLNMNFEVIDKDGKFESVMQDPFVVEKSQIGVPSLDGSFGLTEREALETLRAAVIREYGRKDYRVDNITDMINEAEILRRFDAAVKNERIPSEERLAALSSAITDMLKDAVAHKNVARYCDSANDRAMAFADVFGNEHGSMLSEREWAGRAQGAEFVIQSFLAEMSFALPVR